MADLILRPLLAHNPEAFPPRSWRVLWLPVLLAVVGILIAWAAVTTGQDARRGAAQMQIEYDKVYWANELARLRLQGAPPEKIEKTEAIVEKYNHAGMVSYAKYGRQFTSWDGYRYEEIVDQGYVFHMPGDSPEEKNASAVMKPGWPERRTKNVVWYPLYPLLGWMVSRGLHIETHHALTAVSWVSCVLGAVVMFMYTRRHFYNRIPKAESAGETAPVKRWEMLPHDTAAMFAVAALLFGPCSVFLYANFTESVFVLLLGCFLYCIQGRWWWRAALVAMVASSCRSQGVLFGPVLALTYLLRQGEPNAAKKVGVATLLGFISAIGLMCYMGYLQYKFGDALAFMHGQKYWNVGLNWERIRYAANPANAMSRVMWYGFYAGPVDWPRLWEACCLIWPPILLLILGGRYLSFELEIMGWILWGLPYVSNSMAGFPPMDSQWMSMGRFMAVMVPAYVILGATFVRVRWLGMAFVVVWAAAFGVFAMKYGMGAWVG